MSFKSVFDASLHHCCFQLVSSKRLLKPHFFHSHRAERLDVLTATADENSANLSQ